MSPWKYTLAHLIPGSVIVGFAVGGPFTFLTPVVVFVLIPVLDFIVGTDNSNLSAQEMEEVANRLSFRMVLYLYVPVQIAILLFGAFDIANGERTGLEIIGLTLSIGVMTGGLGITIAHELAHKKRRLDQALGQILLMTVSYMHFYIEHNIGHHTNVATAKDPATARFGESFYQFLPRTVFGSFKSAWRTEANRLIRENRAIGSPYNRMLWFTALPILLAITLAFIFGGAAFLFFFAQSIIAFCLLEAVNYLEHYGLLRTQTGPGKYEQVTPAHSWNANQRLTNYLLFKLQRHADHHVHPVRAYQTLRHFDESPQLPTGYAGMILLALVPPLWRKIMDQKVLELQASGSAITK